MRFLRRFRFLLHRKQLDCELKEELQLHQEMKMQSLQDEGLPAEEAYRAARLEMGNTALTAERSRDVWSFLSFEHWIQDLRYALRVLRKSPGFTMVAVIILALGIGANTAIFSLIHELLLRSLPVTDPDRLVRITYASTDQEFGLSGPMFDEIGRRQQSFSGMLAWSSGQFDFAEGGEIRQIPGAFASGDAFQTLGLHAEIGRMLLPADDQNGGGPAGWAAVISNSFWRTHFNSDPSVLGRSLTIEGMPITIVGVAPAGFDGVEVGARPEVVLPLAFEMQIHGKSAKRNFSTAFWLTVMARLKPGVTLEQARADLQRIVPGMIAAIDTRHLLRDGFFSKFKFGVVPGRTGKVLLRKAYRQPLFALQALVGIILLLCCANLAGLLSARASARRRELAIRGALGAQRSRLLLQLFTETMLIVVAGTAAGLLFAVWGSRILVALFIRANTLSLDLAPDAGTLLFTIGVSLAVALLVGLPSGLGATRVEVTDDLKSSGQSSRGESRIDSWFVSGQVALSAMLLVAAGLLSGTLYHLLHFNPGFRTEGVLIVPTDFSKRPEKNEHLIQFYERILERLVAMPGAQVVSAEEMTLLTGWTSSTSYASTLPDGSLKRDDLSYNRVGPNYFSAAGTAILAGRDFLVTDLKGSRQVCAINYAAARYFFPDGNVVGNHLYPIYEGKPTTPCEVIAVVENTKYTSLRAPSPRIIYMTFMQNQMLLHPLSLVVRTDNPAVAAESVRNTLRELAPGSPLLDPVTVKEQLKASIGQETTMAMLALFFGFLGLLLVAIGLYGLLSYRVSQRVREIGIRIALGAKQPDVLRLVLKQGLVLTSAGLALGLAFSAVVTRFLRGMLFDMHPLDPLIFTAAAAVLTAIALLASYIPAHRASKVDPMAALRNE